MIEQWESLGMKKRMQNLTGETIVTVEGKKLVLGKIVGFGGQGVVYEVQGENNIVIKLYYPSGSSVVDDGVLERISYIRNYMRYVKLPTNFVVILDLIKTPFVGYVMEKVSGYKSLNSYLIPDKELSFSDWYNKGLGLRERIFIGFVIAKAFAALERVNLSYCDISGNNILVKINKSVSIKMIDVDNIYMAGKGTASVLGTPRYIAPEVISGQKNPDVLSDNYSLAVILFELLRVGHPYISDDILDGTPDDEEVAYAGKLDYVTDANSSNMLPSDIVFTDKLTELFHKCFVDGKINRLVRPSARDFQFALLDASNKVIKCPNCGAWHYPKKKGKKFVGCPWCEAPTSPRALLNFYDVLLKGKEYKSGKTVDGSLYGELVNTYILREGKNQIKSLYVLRYDDLSKEERSSENYLTIAKDRNGYWAYNQFSKNGIIIKKNKSKEYYRLENNKALRLENEDRIYFELTHDGAVLVGNKEYSFIRMARFLEV